MYLYSVSVSNRLLQLKQLLEFVSTKDQFKWKGNAEELTEFIILILETSERPKLSEDPAHNLLTLKILNVIVKWWKKTQTIAIQGKDQKRFRDKLVELLQLNSSSDVSCLTIAAENGGNSGQASFDPENSIIFNGVSSPSTNQALESLLSKCTGCSILEEKFLELKFDVEILILI